MELRKETVIKTTSHQNVIITKVENVAATTECQYQTVQRNKQTKTDTNIDELIKQIQPAKSFLYRNQTKKPERVATSYVPMNVGLKKRRLFRLSYDYPNFDLSRFRFSKNDNFNDRGYYQVKNDSDDRTKQRTYSSVQDIYEDHLYEDLNYNDVKERRNSATVSAFSIVKLQGLINTIRKPFSKKVEEVENKGGEGNEAPIYENSDSVNSLYDTVKVRHSCDCNKTNGQPALVEEYLEPIQHQKETDYCDVEDRARGESFLDYLLSIFETTFGRKKETNDPQDSEDAKTSPEIPERSGEKTFKADGKMAGGLKMADGIKMADRPLPVPVDKEPYYMNLDRRQAEELLLGQPDGAFILRPSSQPAHEYTLSVSCGGVVHNVGVRRRPDGRLALGYARKGERCFATIPALVRHHRRRRLLLVAGGGVLGAVTLTEPPLHYRTPSNIPVVPNSHTCLAKKCVAS